MTASHPALRAAVSATAGFALWLILSAPVRANHPTACTDCENPMGAILAINQLVVFDAPLPITHFNKGDWRTGLKPVIFNVDQLFRRPGAIYGGGMKGWGGAVTFSYALTDRWLAYSMLTGARITGTTGGRQRNAGECQGGPPNCPVITSDASQIPADQHQVGGSASVITLNTGVGYDLFRSEGGMVSMPVFVGAFVQRLSADLKAGRAPTYSATFGGQFPEVDYTGKNTIPGISAGAQCAVNLGKYVQAVPFFVGSMIFKNPSFKTRVTANGSATFPVGYEEENELLKHGEGDRSRQFFPAAGLNLTYRPWGLTLSVGGFLTSYYSQTLYDGLKLTKFSLSYSFGKYTK